MSSSPYTVATVVGTVPAGSRGITIELDVRLEARAGQFAMIWLPGLDEKPFSLVDGDPATLTVIQVGPFTERLQGVRAGDRLYLRGPLGHGFSLVGERPLLVGGGCGAAPLAFLAKQLRSPRRAVAVALGARTAGGLLLRERFLALGAELRLCTEDGSAGEQGLVTELVAHSLAAGEHDRVYACGPVPMLEKVTELCLAYGVGGELSWEAYMRCGIGVCGSCDRGDGLLVCRDGPVFAAA